MRLRFRGMSTGLLLLLCSLAAAQSVHPVTERRIAPVMGAGGADWLFDTGSSRDYEKILRGALHSRGVNRLDGLTIAVSENKYINQIARRTILSEDALSVLVPILEDIAGWNSVRIRALFEAHGFVLREWDKVQTDSLTICRSTASGAIGHIV